jgi:hypothetical protein
VNDQYGLLNRPVRVLFERGHAIMDRVGCIMDLLISSSIHVVYSFFICFAQSGLFLLSG